MGLLLYKSSEMFSATELIRKSKMIFDKVVNDEIDKAIILRDGKPGFLLMDFAKYERIMAEYEKLKFDASKAKHKKNKPEIKIKKEIIKEVLPIKTEIIKEKQIIQPKQKPAFVTPPRPKANIEEIKLKEIEESSEIFEEIVVEKSEKKEVIPTISADDELKTALESLRSMNFSDDMRAEAEKKIKAKLLKAREERAALLALQEEDDKEDLKEELEVQVHIKEENKKKEQELKEFWD